MEVTRMFPVNLSLNIFTLISKQLDIKYVKIASQTNIDVLRSNSGGTLVSQVLIMQHQPPRPSVTPGRRCASIVARARIDALRQCGRSPFNAEIDRLLAALGSTSRRGPAVTEAGGRRASLRRTAKQANQSPPNPPAHII